AESGPRGGDLRQRVRAGLRHRFGWLANSSRLVPRAGSAPLVDPDPLAPVVAVCATPRFVTGLAAEWHVRETLVYQASDAIEESAILFIEMRGAHPAAAPDLTVSHFVMVARAAQVPVVLWWTQSRGDSWDEAAVTDLFRVPGQESDDPIPDTAMFYVDDLDAANTWSAASGRTVRYLPPAAAPSIHSPRVGGAARKRSNAAVLTHGTWDPARIAPVPSDHLDLLDLDSVQQPDGAEPALAPYREAVALGDGPALGWAMVEAAMSSTPLVVDETAADLLAPGLRRFASVASSDEELRLDVAARLWQDEVVDREALAIGRAARSLHGWANRTRTIEDDLRLRPRGVWRDVSVIVPTNRLHELDNVAENVARQVENEYGNVQLVLVLHGLDVDEADLRARYRDAGVDHLEIVRADPSITLGACMNLGIDASDGRYIAKVDDDNYYGKHYLTDLVDSFSHSGAGIVGKWCHYVWLRSSNAVILRFPNSEHKFERLVQGGSIILDGDVARDLRFGDLPRAVDTDILTRAKQAGVSIYSADRFNFVSIRGADRHAHTWPISDMALMNRAGQVVFFGDPRPHVEA
ncbi:glycosyltransferase family A protein, partial [Kribbia dieselivorans]|uniref:glycosyltransferase family A protein n=1 Tax=Kribbia dieselivorans TaxID=331526 RepID=UPI0012ECC4BF